MASIVDTVDDHPPVSPTNTKNLTQIAASDNTVSVVDMDNNSSYKHNDATVSAVDMSEEGPATPKRRKINVDAEFAAVCLCCGFARL